MERETVDAAGGALWRRDATGTVSVLLVHRPRYDDWSWPKGKVDQGESLEETALREVEEETGVRAVIAAPLTQTRYLDGMGREKTVTYYVMTPVHEEPRTPDHEVDETRWLPLATVEEVLTWDVDHAVARALREYLAHEDGPRDQAS